MPVTVPGWLSWPRPGQARPAAAREARLRAAYVLPSVRSRLWEQSPSDKTGKETSQEAKTLDSAGWLMLDDASPGAHVSAVHAP